MLQAIREKTSGWIAYGIIFLISVPFALWGINSYFEGGSAAPAAVVNGQEITTRDLDRAYASYRQRLMQVFGGSIPPALDNEVVLKSQVLDQLIEEASLRSYVATNNYRISDESLGQMIREMEAFQRDGEFESSIYQAQLRSLGYSPVGFEQEMRVTQSSAQLQRAIEASTFTTPVTRNRFNNLANQSRKIRVISTAVDTEIIEITDDAIRAHFDENAARYQTPEQVKVDYLTLSLDEVKDTIAVDEQELLQRYEDYRQTFVDAEVRNASHILLTLAQDADEASSTAVLNQMAEIADRVRRGESFADLAREFSQDPGSAADGGELGDIERGVMVPAFEATLFEMAEGELSDPVRTPFGWHLIKLNTVSSKQPDPLEMVRLSLEDELKIEEAESQLYDLLESLSNLAYENEGSLEPASEQLGLTIQTSDWFDRFSGSGVASNPMVRTMAFSEEVLSLGRNSEAIELEGGSVLFIRLNEFKEASPRPLDEVRDRIVNELQLNRGIEVNEARGGSALDLLLSGTALEDIASTWSAEIVDHGFIERTNTEVGPELVRLAFELAKPDDRPAFDGITLSDGSFAIVELSAVVSSNSEEQDDLVNGLRSARSAGDYRSILTQIVEQSEVTRTPIEDLL